MAQITVDIQAKVVGYEQSIKQMQAALSKVDPGSEMGKKITSALSQAQKQVAALSKNMFPKASSDTQIDAIVEKANRAGESIREVANLMQNLTIKDLNLDALGSGFEGFKNELASLQNDLNSKLNAGLRDAIQNSTTLSGVFNKLGTDLSKADANTLFTDLARGAKEARAETENAEKALEKINQKITNNELSTNALKLSNVSTLEGRQNLDAELKSITGQYDDFFTTLREKMRIGMESITQNTGIDSTKLLDSFFSGLTPDTVKQKIDELTANLSATGKGKREIYKAIFGEGTTEYRDYNAVINSLNLDGQLENIKAALTNFLEKIRNDIKPEQHLQITRLIDNNSIEEATNQTISDLDKAYARIQSSLQKNAVELSTLMGQKTVAQTNLSAAQNNESTIEAVRAELQRQIDDALNQNKTLTDRIAQLEATIEQIKSQAVGATKSAGANIKQESFKNTFPLEESEAYKAQLAEIAQKEQALGKIQGVIQRWFSIYTVVRAVSNAIKSVISTLKELDATITEIAIVTSMNQDELWGQMGSYTDMAQQYAASISGVYKISQLYYQQGLQTAEVMQLTEQTLKMARISGLDYAQATDYMTNAVRSFKMEMSDAQRVVDVYSAVAARSATDTTELASAMSKTASSAEAVGSSFESTTAMMAVMIEATRESAENIGSAMKSIISRYGEMTSDPSKLMDSEGEEMSLNRVDKALQTVGITIHDTAGKFRDFDDVIMELAAAWDTIDTNTQRYIATTMAGNRQQSRFLALVSSYERLNELTNVAEDSEDASQLQYLKTLDSIDAKTQQLQTSMQALYTDTGIESFYKGLLDVANNIIITFNRMPTVFNLPVVALATLGAQFWNIASVVSAVFAYIKANFAIKSEQIRQEMLAKEQQYNASEVQQTRETEEEKLRLKKEYAERAATESQTGYVGKHAGKDLTTNTTGTKQFKTSSAYSGIGLGLQTIGATLSIVSAGMGEATAGARAFKSTLMGAAGAASAVGMALNNNVIGAVIMGATTLINVINTIVETAEERAERLKKAAEEANNTRIKTASEYKNLKSEIEELEKLEAARYDSAEAAQAYFEASAKIAESMPELVSSYDTEGNAIINLNAAYDKLKQSREDAAKAAQESADKAVDVAVNAQQEAEKVYGEALATQINNTFTVSSKGLEENKYLDNNEPTTIANVMQGIWYDRDLYEGSYDRITNFVNAVREGKVTELGAYYSQEDARDYLNEQLVELQNNNEEATELVYTLQAIVEMLYGKESYNIKQGQTVAATRQATAGKKKAAIATQVGSWMTDLSDTEGVRESYLSEFVGATDLLTSAMSSQFFNPNQTETNVTTWLNLDDTEKSFKNINDIFANWWNSLSPDAQKIKNELFTSIKQYNVDDWVDAFGIEDENIQAILREYYANITYSAEQFYDAIKVRTKDAKDHSHYTSANKIEENLNLGAKEYQSLLNITDAIDKRVLAGGISEETANDIITNFQNGIINASEEVQGILFNTDLFSFSSLSEALTQLQGLDQTQDVSNAIENIQKIMQLIPTNINTETQTLLSTFSTQVENFDKALKNATSGMDFKTASELAAKLGKSLSEFDLKDGKYYFNDLQAIKNAYIDENTQYINNFKDNIESRYKLIEELDTNGIIGKQLLSGAYTVKTLSDKFNSDKGKEEFLDATGIGYDEFINYYTDFQAQASTGISDFLEYLISQISDIETTMSSYLSSNMASTALKSGNIKGFMQATNLWKPEEIEEQEVFITKTNKNQLAHSIITNESKIQQLSQNEEYRNKAREELTGISESQVQNYAQSLKMQDININQDLDNQLIQIKDLEQYKNDIINEILNDAELLQSEEVQAEIENIKQRMYQNSSAFVEEVEQFDIDELDSSTGTNVDYLEDWAIEFEKMGLSVQDVLNYALGNFEESLMTDEDFEKLKNLSRTLSIQKVDFNSFYNQAKNEIMAENAMWGFTEEQLADAIISRQKELYDNWIRLNNATIQGIESNEANLQAQALTNLGYLDENKIAQQATERLNAAREHNEQLIAQKRDTNQDYVQIARQELQESGQSVSEEDINKKVREIIKAELEASGEWLSENYEDYVTEVQDEETARAMAEAAKEANAKIQSAIASGDISVLTGDLEQWQGLVQETFNSVVTSTFSSMKTALQGGSNQIKVTETNINFLQQLQNQGYVSEGELTFGKLAEFDVEAIKNDADNNFKAFIDSLNIDQKSKEEYIKSYLDVKYPDVISSITTMAGKTSISRSDFQSYLTSIGKTWDNEPQFDKLVRSYYLRFNEATNSYEVIDEEYDKYIAKLQKDVEKASDSESKIAAQIKLDAAQRTHANKDDSAVRKAFQDVISNYSSVTDEQYTALQTALGENWEQVANYFTKDGSTYNLDVSAVRAAIESGVGNMSEDTQAFLLGMLTSIVDNGLKSISTGVSQVTSGTTSQSEMQNFLTAYNERMGDTAKIGDLYDYNSVLEAWTLKPEKLREFVTAQGQYLVDQGLLVQDQLDQYINDNVNKKLVENIDITSFLDAENKGVDSDAYKKLAESMRQYYQYISGSTNSFDAKIDSRIQALQQGGLSAVAVLKQFAQEELSTDDIEKAYKLQFNKLSDAMSALEDIQVGDVVSKEVAGVLRQISGFTINADGIVMAVGDLVEAYENIYNQIKNNAISTTNDINKAYAKLLTARNRDNVNALDILENAAGMTYEAFGDMLSQYNIRLEDALSHADRFGIQDTGFGKIRVTDFNALASRMGWNIDSPKYAEAYNSWVDSMAELVNQPATFMQSAADQLKGLTEAKPNQAINVSYLDKQLNGTLEDIVTSYSAQLHNGLLTITETTDLPALIQAISQQAAATGAMIPEQLAEVADAVEGLLDQIISLIKGGISGSMSNVDAVNLSKWANDNGIGAIQFTETNEGLKLTQESLAQIYVQLKQIDAIQAQGLLPEIQKSSNSYSSFNKVLFEYNELQKKINTATVDNKKLARLNSARGKVQSYEQNLNFSDDNVSRATEALVTSTKATEEQYVTVAVTPILPDGYQITDELAQAYGKNFLDGVYDLETEIAHGFKFKDIFVGLHDTLADVDTLKESFVELKEAAEDVNEVQISGLTDELRAQQSMLTDMITDMMTMPDSFNFMSQSLPDAMQSVKNVYENAYSALDTIKSAKSSGYMDLQDFYNIVTTASNYMEAAGKEFNVKGMNAAELIEAAGKELVTVDGTLSVDLSSSGLDIQGSLSDMSEGLTSGINELADAEVAMLDAEIQVMEVFAAMEQLGDVDVDGNGINFELKDIFTSDTNPTEFTNEFDEWKSALLKLTEDKNYSELKTALQSWIINGTSFYDLLSSGASEWINAFGSAENVSKFLQNFDTTDWDLDNIQQQVKNFISQMGTDQTIVVENGAISMGVDGNLIALTWDDSKKEEAIEYAAKWLKDDISGEDTNAKLTRILSQYTTGEFDLEGSIKARTILGIATGDIQIKDEGTSVDKDKRYTGTYNGVKFSGATKSEVEQKIGEAMVYTDAGFQFTYEKGQITGLLTVGSTNVKVKATGNGKFTATFGSEEKTFKSQHEAMAWLASKGVGTEEGQTYDFEGKDYTIRIDSSTGFSYAYVKNPDGEEWIYNGNSYKSEELAKQAMLADSLTVKDKNGRVKNVKDENGYKVISTGDLLKIHHVEDGDDIYEFNGNTNLTRQQYEALVKAYRRGSGTDDDVIKDDDGTIKGYTYYEGNQKVSVVLKDGGVEYSFECDGYTFTATSEAGLKQALADYQWVTGGEITPSDTNDKSYTITADGVEIKVTYTDDGVVIEGVNGDIPEKMREYFKNKFGTDGIPVDGSGTKIKYNISDGDTEITENGQTPSADVKVQATKDASFDSNVAEMKGNVTNDPPKMTPGLEVKSALKEGAKLKNAISNLKPELTVTISDSATEVINNIKSTLEEMANNTYDITVKATVSQAKGNTNTDNDANKKTLPKNGANYVPAAKGNVALASGNQKTLMGELGPELVVSNGRYFVVGQSGAEMVDLPKDAIVFNHQQTASLLANGHSGRGKAVTNETNAVSFAKGNIQGPAMASASAALATLKQLKAMWESLQDASVQDLAGKAGGGGGGGGGSSDSSSRKSWVEDVERWYNLMQKISQLETDITQQETLRTKLNSDFNKNGKAYYESQKKTLDMLDQQIIAQNELNISRQAYFTKRQGQLNKEGAFKDLYEFDENGQLKYKDFSKAKKVSFTDSEGNKISNTYKNGFEFLSDLTARNDNGESKYTVEQQYELLKAMGYEKQMKYDSSGNEITKETDDEGNENEDQSTFYSNSVQAVWDLIESQKSEMQDLHDTIEDGQNKMNELMNDRNEILKEIRDNQMAVENAVLNAIADSRQRAIDNLQDQRDALEDSTSKYIQGLTDQLNAEKAMYENAESEDDLNTKRRRLAILQRSGGSASEISSLQSEILSSEKDMYFDKFQEQIDAIQAASDKEIERLDAQIDLMTETLEYQKENGLLWDEVYQIMDGKSGAGIMQYIMDNDSSYWGNSPLKSTEEMNNLLFQSEQWTAFRDDQKLSNKETKAALAEDKITTSDIHSAVYGTDSGETEWTILTKSMKDLYGSKWSKIADSMEKRFDKEYDQTGDIVQAQQEVLENNKTEKAVKEKFNLPGYDSGGLARFTGLAQLDGTQAKPEAVLTQAQTEILRNDILGNSRDSLLNLLVDFRSVVSGMNQSAAYTGSASDNSVSIENAAVNMYVDSIANDYDARNAGDEVMNEMLRIARKTNANNSVGR